MSEITREQAISDLVQVKRRIEEATDSIFYIVDELGDRRGYATTIRLDNAITQLQSWLLGLMAEEDEAQRANVEVERMIDGWQEEFDALHSEEA